MERFVRWVVLGALALGACGRVGAEAVPPPPTTTTTAAPVPTTTTSTSTTAAPRAAKAAPAPAVSRVSSPATTTRPPATQPRPTGKIASCGWAWDARRMDDGSSNEVTVMLDAPRQAAEAVTITVKPGGANTSTPAMSRSTATDGSGQAAATFALSNDKRDWTLTVSATFGSGAACAPQTFTLEY